MNEAGEESGQKLLRPLILARMKLAKKKVQKLIKKASTDRNVKRWKGVEDEMEEDYHSFWRKVELPSMRSPNNVNGCTFANLDIITFFLVYHREATQFISSGRLLRATHRG